MSAKYMRWMVFPAAALFLAALAGCNSSVSGVYRADDFVVEFGPSCCNDQSTNQVDVTVTDESGNRISGASVDLDVATVPEQHYTATAGGDGIARFQFIAPANVTIVAYACAPGYECNAADAPTPRDARSLFLNVVLSF